MLNHALKIVARELNEFLDAITTQSDDLVVLGNIAQMDAAAHVSDDNVSIKDKIILTVVNIREEKTLKNGVHFTQKATGLEYHNPPVYLNLFLLFSVNTNNYTHALAYLSRIIRFFQSKNVFTHLDTSLEVADLNEFDRLETFKLIFDLHSPSFEELNHLWGTLGGKQLPFVLYQLRMLELKHARATKTGGIVEEIVINNHLRNQK